MNLTPASAPVPSPHSHEFAARLLGNAKTIAVVGFSSDPNKAAHFAPMELVKRGYDVIPVNPNVAEIAGIPTVASLDAIDRHVDIVDVFRPADEAPAIARQAAAIGADTLWLQKGIVSDEAGAVAADAGMNFIEDQCVKQVAGAYDLLAKS